MNSICYRGGLQIEGVPLASRTLIFTGFFLSYLSRLVSFVCVYVTFAQRREAMIREEKGDQRRLLIVQL